MAEQIDQLLYNKNQEMQNDSKENVSLQDYIQKEAEVSNDEELLELLKQLEELSEEEAHGIFESNLIEEGVKMRSDLLAKLSSLSPEKRAWLQKQMQKRRIKKHSRCLMHNNVCGLWTDLTQTVLYIIFQQYGI